MSPLSRNPRDATIQLRDIQRWGRCRGSLRGRSHGRHVHRPSLDRWLALTGFRSVRSCSALLFGDRAARYGVAVWSGVDVLTNFLRVVRGPVVSVVVVWSGVDVLTNFLPVVRGAVVYPGKKDHHKRVTTERPHPTGGSCPREGHGKGKLIRILFSVYFGGFRG